jgi:hypothetical protein
VWASRGLVRVTLGGVFISPASVAIVAVVVCGISLVGLLGYVAVTSFRSKRRSRAEWRRLAARFPARNKVSGKRYRHQTAQIGEQAYTALITFYASAEGLYVLEEGRYKRTCRLLRLGHAALFIPWDDIHPITIGLAFEDKLRLDLGAPSVATFVVAETLWDKLIEDRLPNGRGEGGGRSGAHAPAKVQANSGSDSIAATSPPPVMPPLVPSELPNYFSYRRREAAKSWLWQIGGLALFFVLFAFVFVGFLHADQTLGIYLGGIAVVLWMLFLMPFVYLMNIGNRMRAPSAKDILARDSRAPVLFLRSFDEESLDVMGHVYEEDLVAGLQPIGPAVAIGRPGEPRPALGAARFYVDDQHWQEAVLFVLDYARAVVLQVGGSSGLGWEIEHVLGDLHPESLLFYFPLTSAEKDSSSFSSRLRRKYPDIALTVSGRMGSDAPKADALEAMNAKKEERWEKFVARYGALIPSPLPAKLGDASFLCFESDWTPVLLKMRASSKDSASGWVSKSLAPFLSRFPEVRAYKPPRSPFWKERHLELCWYCSSSRRLYWTISSFIGWQETDDLIRLVDRKSRSLGRPPRRPRDDKSQWRTHYDSHPFDSALSKNIRQRWPRQVSGKMQVPPLRPRSGGSGRDDKTN